LTAGFEKLDNLFVINFLVVFLVLRVNVEIRKRRASNGSDEIDKSSRSLNV